MLGTACSIELKEGTVAMVPAFQDETPWAGTVSVMGQGQGNCYLPRVVRLRPGMERCREPTASSRQYRTAQGQAVWPPQPSPGAQPSRAHLRPGLRLPGLCSGWSCACSSRPAELRCRAALRVSTDRPSMTVSSRQPLEPLDTLLQQPIEGLGLPLPPLSANGECAALWLAPT